MSADARSTSKHAGDAVETDGGRAECPVCGAPVRAVVTMGPDEHHAEPCGHRVSGACVDELRSEQGDDDWEADE